MTKSFQDRVEPWFRHCFPPEVCNNKTERAHRFFEEATELCQTTKMTREEAHRLVDYVYDRPVGAQHQEIGGVMVTLAAFCIAHQHDMHQCGEFELERINDPEVTEKIRAKQAAKKDIHSPLPGNIDIHIDIHTEEDGTQIIVPPKAKPIVWLITAYPDGDGRPMTLICRSEEQAKLTQQHFKGSTMTELCDVDIANEAMRRMADLMMVEDGYSHKAARRFFQLVEEKYNAPRT